MKKLFAKDEIKLLGAFYLERFISHLVYFAPAFWVIFFNQTLSLTQVCILFAVLAASTFIFEIPTGAFADIFGRKASTLFSYAMLSLTFAAFIFVTDFYLLIGVFILWGLFGTFYSGAREAWTIDNLKYHKREDLVQSYFLKEHSLVTLGKFLSGILGAFLVVTLGIKSIWAFASLSWIISFILLLPVEEHKLTKEKKTTFKKLNKQSREAIKYSLKHYALSFILISTFFIMFSDSFGGELIWQPFLKELGLPLYAFGFLFSLTMILGSIAPFIAKPLLSFCKSEKYYLILLMFFGMLLNFSASLANSYYSGAIIMLSAFFLIDMFSPISSSFIQGFIPSKSRATITSFKSMITSLAYMISYPLAGFAADHLGTKQTIVIAGLFMIPAIYFYSKINLREKVNK